LLWTRCLLSVRAGILLVTSEVTVLFETFTTILANNGLVVRYMIADVRDKILVGAVGVVAVNPLALWVDNRALDMFYGKMGLIIC
jgi:hypothetical protein